MHALHSPRIQNQISFASDISPYHSLSLIHDRLRYCLSLRQDLFFLFEYSFFICLRITYLDPMLFRLNLRSFFTFLFHFQCILPFSYPFPTFLFVGVGLALMSGLHCYLGRLPACSCGWNYLVYLAWRPSSASVSNRRRRRRRRWRPTHWMCLIWTDGQQTACHVCRKTRVLS